MRGGAGGDLRRLLVLRWLLVPAAAGVPLGLLWWWLAPTAQVQVARVGDDVVRYSAAVPELDAVQDVTLLLPSVVFGLVTGLVVLLRGRASPALSSALAAAGSLLGSGVAYLVGHLLGPGAIPVPPGEDAAPATGLSPLVLHSWGVLLVWAVVALLVMTTGHLAAVWTTRPDDADGADADHADVAGADGGGTAGTGTDGRGTGGGSEGGGGRSGAGRDPGGRDDGGASEGGASDPDDLPRGGGPQRVVT